MFDKCSELDKYYKNNYTYRNMSASADTLNNCDKLKILSQEHYDNNKQQSSTSVTSDFNIDFGNFGNASNLQMIFKNVPGLPIYLLIILAIITNIFIAIPFIPVIMSGSLIFVIICLLLIILIMAAIYFIFR